MIVGEQVMYIQENSKGRTHVSRTPKFEYLIAQSQLTEPGLLVRFHQCLMECNFWNAP